MAFLGRRRQNLDLAPRRPLAYILRNGTLRATDRAYWLGISCRYNLGSGIQTRTYVVQLAGVDQVQAFFSNALEARKDFINWRLHYPFTSLVAGEVEIQMLAHETIRHAGKAIERVFDAVAKQFPPE